MELTVTPGKISLKVLLIFDTLNPSTQNTLECTQILLL